MKNNGKSSEAAIAAALKKLDIPCFDWQRMYDATSARGAFMAQVGDFEFFTPDLHGVIEVKSTKHPNRISKASFSDGQRAKLYRRTEAGGKVWVIVHHWLIGLWHVLPYAEIHQAFTVEGKSSIDLSNHPAFTSAPTALAEVIERSITNEQPVHHQ